MSMSKSWALLRLSQPGFHFNQIHIGLGPSIDDDDDVVVGAFDTMVDYDVFWNKVMYYVNVQVDDSYVMDIYVLELMF